MTSLHNTEAVEQGPTPGPWQIAPTLNDDRIGIYDSYGYRIASEVTEGDEIVVGRKDG